jgi:tRNA/rRNA methyltransferase
MDEKTRKENSRFVLVEPIYPGNIGSCARALMNMGYEKLCLVNPPPFLVEEAFQMACAAKPILYHARVEKSLQGAISDAQLVIGLTARLGQRRGPHITLAEAIDRALKTSENGPVSFVFGREDCGLVKDELLQCHLITEIPSHQDLRSLNLAQAVLIVAYELYKKSFPHEARTRADKSMHKIPAPTVAEMDHLYQHLEAVMRKAGYQKICDKSSRDVVSMALLRFRRIFGRAGMEKRDVETIEGFCSRIEMTLKRAKSKKTEEKPEK